MRLYARMIRWVDLMWALPGLLVVPGLRADSFSITYQKRPRRTLDPRLAVRYALSDAVTV